MLNKSEPDRLSLNEKADLITQATQLNAKTLVIPGTGEPTLDRDFYPLLDIANRAGMITVVYSNLTGNVDRNKITKMLNSNVSIGIKLDSFDPKYFKKRYHVKEKVFEKFLENLHQIVDLYQGSDQPTEQGRAYRAIANMVLTRENMGELERITEFCRKSNLPLFVRPVKPVIWASKELEKWKEIGNSSGLLNPELDLIKLASQHNTLFSPSSTPENHCAIYSFGLTIKNNGDIQVCPDHHESRGLFGNVRKESLSVIIKRLNEQRTIKSGFCVMLPDIDHKSK